MPVLTLHLMVQLGCVIILLRCTRSASVTILINYYY